MVRANRKKDKELVWMGGGGIENPPFSDDAKRESGYLIRELQRGKRLGLPGSGTMPEIGKDCHALRITDKNLIHRVFYAIRTQAIVVLHILPGKKSQKTPKYIIELCKSRLSDYENRTGDKR